MPLDRATTQFMQSMAEGADPDAKPLHEMTPEEARAFGSSLADTAGPAPAMARVEEHTLERDGGSAGNVGLRVLVPIDPPAGVIVYYHGGGWVIGSIDEFDTLAGAQGWPSTAIRSRTPHWNGRCVRIAAAVRGGQRRGQPANVVAVRARDRKGPEIALQILIYPVWRTPEHR